MIFGKWTYLSFLAVCISAFDTPKEAPRVVLPPILSIVNGISTFPGYEPLIKHFLERNPTYDEQFTDSLGRMVFVANRAIYHKPGGKGSDESAQKMFQFFLNTLKRIGKPVDKDAISGLYSQRVYVRPEGDTVQLRELRAVVEALLTGNATVPVDDERVRELTRLSSLYGIVLMKLLKSALPSSAERPPFKVEALVEDMQRVDGLFELTYRRSDGTRPLDVEQRHLDAVEELLKSHVKAIHSGVKEGRFPESFLKTLQERLAGLKKRKHALKGSDLEVDSHDAENVEEL